MRRKIDFWLVLLTVAYALSAQLPGRAQTADQGWLRYGRVPGGQVFLPVKVRALGTGLMEQAAVEELERSLKPCCAKAAEMLTSGQGLSARARAVMDGQTVLGTFAEVRKAFPKIPLPSDVAPQGYWIYSSGSGEQKLVLIAGADEPGVLYGTFALLRLNLTAAEGSADQALPRAAGHADPLGRRMGQRRRLHRARLRGQIVIL